MPKRRPTARSAAVPAWCPKFICALRFFLDDRLPKDAWDLFLSHARTCPDCHGIASAALEGMAGLGAIFGAINDRFGKFMQALKGATSGPDHIDPSKSKADAVRSVPKNQSTDEKL